MARDVEAEFEDSAAYRRVKQLLEGGEEWSVECRTIYSEFIEFGAGPAAGHARFMPPLKPILEWTQRKLGLKGEQAKRAAEGIRWAIYRSGTRPQPFARPAIQDLKAVIGEVVGDALESGEDPMHAVMDFIRSQMRHHIDQNGTNDEGTLAREMHIVQGGL
jgi:hypothetical protein